MEKSYYLKTSAIILIALLLGRADVPVPEETIFPAPPVSAWTLKPNAVMEKQAFKLQILSEKYGSCGTEFPNTEAGVHINTILLRYSMKKDPNIVCIQNEIPWGPTFEIQPLSAGTYKVMAAEIADCIFQGCKIAEPAPKVIGTLTVNRDGGWSIKPEVVEENKAFQLRILNKNYESCGTEFSNTIFRIAGNSIFLSYSMERLPIICVQSTSPWGPTFQMEPLKAGAYDVMVVPERPACLYGPDPCDVMEPVPVKIGNLLVRSAGTYSGTTIMPEKVEAEKAFTLFVSSDRYNLRSRPNVTKAVQVMGNSILLNFDPLDPLAAGSQVTQYTVTDFMVPGLSPGQYQVFLYSEKDCNTQPTKCFDSSNAIGAVTAAQNALRLIYNDVAALKPEIQVKPGRLSITLTDNGLSAIRADLFSASGALIKSAGMGGSETNTLSFDLPAGLRQEVYLLQLSARGNTFYHQKIWIGR